MSVLVPRSLLSRALALGILACFAGAVWTITLAPIKAWYDDNDQAITDRIRVLAALKVAIAQGREAGAQLTAADLERYRGDFLAGHEDSMIVADLQTRLSTSIGARKAELSSALALTAKSRDGLEYLGLRLQIRAEMKHVQEVLHAIETGTPLLFVERAALRLDERVGAGRAPSADRLAPLSLEVDVYGAKWPNLVGAGPVGKGR